MSNEEPDLPTDQFIEDVVANERVWHLSNDDGVANTASIDDENTVVLMFWSQQNLAQRVMHSGFDDYQVVEIPLFDFLVGWLPGMDEDAVLTGLNWTKDLVGIETDPDQLRDDIQQQLPAETLTRYEAMPG